MVDESVNARAPAGVIPRVWYPLHDLSQRVDAIHIATTSDPADFLPFVSHRNLQRLVIPT